MTTISRDLLRALRADLDAAIDLLRALRADLDAAIVTIGKKHGVILNMGSASFTTQTATFKMNVTAPSDGNLEVNPLEAKAAEDYKALAKLYNCDPAWLGKTFGDYTIVGLLPKSHKYPVLVRVAGKLLKVTQGTVRIRAIAA